MLHTKNNDFHVGQWVRVNDTYAGPSSLPYGIVLSKIKGITTDELLVLETRVSNNYGTSNLIVKKTEVDKITLSTTTKDKNGRQINVGDDIAYAVYGGGLRLGRVLEIIPAFSSQYDYSTRKSSSTQTNNLRVEVKTTASSYNTPIGVASKSETRYASGYEATATRRVTDMNRVVVIPKPIYPGISISTGANPLTLIN